MDMVRNILIAAVVGLLLSLVILTDMENYELKQQLDHREVVKEIVVKTIVIYQDNNTESVVESHEEEADKVSRVEISHYGPTGNPCYSGNMPYDGAFAAPPEIPIGTRMIITYDDGSIDEGIVEDRGSRIKTYPNQYKPVVKDAEMRLDRYVDASYKELMALGVKGATVQFYYPD